MTTTPPPEPDDLSPTLSDPWRQHGSSPGDAAGTTVGYPYQDATLPPLGSAQDYQPQDYPAQDYPAQDYQPQDYPPAALPGGFSTPPGQTPPGQSGEYLPPGTYPPPGGYGGYAGVPGGYAPPYGMQPVFDAYGRPLSDKSKVVAGILQIVLGGFGAGRFYIGDNSTAIAQLVVTFLTCGLGHIWGIIDGIMILVNGGVDAQGRVLRE